MQQKTLDKSWRKGKLQWLGNFVTLQKAFDIVV